MLTNDDEKNPTFTSTDEEKSDIFLKYFSSVFTKEPDNDDMPHFDKQNYTLELKDIEIDSDMVSKKLKCLKVNKSPGPDAIHPRVLHEIAPAITTPLVDIFNTSLRTEKLPQEWKNANISVIFKKGKICP